MNTSDELQNQIDNARIHNNRLNEKLNECISKSSTLNAELNQLRQEKANYIIKSQNAIDFLTHQSSPVVRFEAVIPGRLESDVLRRIQDKHVNDTANVLGQTRREIDMKMDEFEQEERRLENSISNVMENISGYNNEINNNNLELSSLKNKFNNV